MSFPLSVLQIIIAHQLLSIIHISVNSPSPLDHEYINFTQFREPRSAMRVLTSSPFFSITRDIYTRHVYVVGELVNSTVGVSCFDNKNYRISVILFFYFKAKIEERTLLNSILKLRIKIKKY